MLDGVVEVFARIAAALDDPRPECENPGRSRLAVAERPVLHVVGAKPGHAEI